MFCWKICYCFVFYRFLQHKSMLYGDNSKAQFVSLLFNEHGFIASNLNELTLEMVMMVWRIGSVASSRQ